MSNTQKEILSVRTIVFNNIGQIAMVRRAEGQERAGYWELPGGKVDRDEQPMAAALREPYEEVGVVAYPTSHLLPIESRKITDGKHEGKDYRALGCTAVARPPFDSVRPSEEADRVGWFRPEEIGNLPNVTSTSQAALRVLL